MKHNTPTAQDGLSNDMNGIDIPEHKIKGRTLVDAFEKGDRDLFQRLLTQAEPKEAGYALNLCITKKLDAAIPEIAPYCYKPHLVLIGGRLIQENDFPLMNILLPHLDLMCDDSYLFRRAVSLQHVDMIKLLAPGSDLNCDKGYALRECAIKGLNKSMECLIDIDPNNPRIDHVLQDAVFCKNTDTLKTLLTKHAFSNTKLKQALYVSVKHDQQQSVELLFDHVSERIVLSVLQSKEIQKKYKNQAQRLGLLQQSREDKRALEQQVLVPARTRERKL